MSEVIAWVNVGVTVVQVLIVPIAGYWAFVLRDMRDRIGAQNGRLGRMEEWRDSHEKLDDERHNSTNTAIDWLRNKASS